MIAELGGHCNGTVNVPRVLRQPVLTVRVSPTRLILAGTPQDEHRLPTPSDLPLTGPLSALYLGARAPGNVPGERRRPRMGPSVTYAPRLHEAREPFEVATAAEVSLHSAVN
jgi:hypothetical protein